MSAALGYRLLTSAEVTAIERKVDLFFDSSEIPGRTLDEARWKIMTVAEDSLRFLLVEGASAWIDPQETEKRSSFILMLDRYKYWLHYALNLLDKRKLPSVKSDIEKFGAEGDDYLKAGRFLYRDSALFADAVGTFSSIWSGYRPAFGKEERDVILLKLNERAIQYHAVEQLTAKYVDEYTPIPLLAAIFAALDPKIAGHDAELTWGRTVSKIVDSVRIRKEAVTYQFVTARGRDLYDYVYNQPSLIPDEWAFPWGTRKDATEFCSGLLSVCFYHLIAVHFGASRNRLKGVGINQIGLNLSVSELARRVSAVSGLGLSKASSMIESLTYGKSTTNPDPALQPFVPVGGQVFIPCMLIITANWPRNMLSLQTRVDSASFDSQSHLFEKTMVRTIEDGSRDRSFVSNKTFSSGLWSEEIYILYIDSSEHLLLVCELRWTIPPGDPREVANRRSAVQKKVMQVRRKSDGVNRHLSQVCRQLGEIDAHSWRVLALVIVGGYSGDPSAEPDVIPVVQQAVFLKMLQLGLSLSEIHRILCTPLWLPRPGIDIEFQRRTDHIGEVEIQDTGYSVIRDRYFDQSINKYVQDCLETPRHSLGSIEW